MNTIYAQAGPGGGTATGKTRQSQHYPGRPKMSRAFRKVISARPDRRSPQAPVNDTQQAPVLMSWRERAALAILSLAGNLQDARHLSARDEAQGWILFTALLLRFVETCPRARAEAGA